MNTNDGGHRAPPPLCLHMVTKIVKKIRRYTFSPHSAAAADSKQIASKSYWS